MTFACRFEGVLKDGVSRFSASEKPAGFLHKSKAELGTWPATIPSGVCGDPAVTPPLGFFSVEMSGN